MIGAPPGFAARFSLVDTSGNPVSDEILRGHFSLVYFGFTNCKVVCPRSLGKLSAVIERLAAENLAIKPLFITIDPERDGPEVVKRFLENAYPAFEGLTGTVEQVEDARNSFRVFAQRKTDPADPQGYDVAHTAIAYLLGPDGEYYAHFGDQLDEKVIFKRIEKIVRRYR